MKLGSLFDGSGTCPLAATLCGITPVWASEIERFPLQVTTKRFPNMKHLGDITKINGAEIEPVDIITFGSPCQDLSVAGRRAGLDGERSNLFMEAIRIIKEMREATNNEYPRYIMWENVPGAFSSNKGFDFRKVLEEIAETNIPMPEGGKWAKSGMVELSDRQLAWRVLDAQYWGVPQRRKRIFLVADFRGQRAAEILFKSDSLRGNPPQSDETWQGASGNSERSTYNTGTDYLTGWDAQDKRIFTDKGVAPTLSGSDGGGGRNLAGVVYPINTQIATRHNRLGKGTGLGVGNEGDPAFTLQATHSHAVATHPDVTGTLCASGAAQSRAAGQCNETDLCIVQSITYGFSPNNSVTAAGVSCEEEKVATLSTTKRAGVVSFTPTSYAQYEAAVGTLRANGGDLGGGSENLVCEQVVNTKGCGGGNSKEIKVATTLSAHGNRQDFESETFIVQTIAGIDCRNATENNELLPTLQAHPGGGYSYNCTHPVRIGNSVRRLTPTECARLQGFPDWWCADIPHSDTAEYKMWGNGMALPCVLYIMQNIAATAT